MRSLPPFAQVRPAGDLRRRAELNFARLHEPPFRFDAMIHASTAHDAPGDWVGRAILGLSVLGQVLATEPKYLEEVIARLPEALNERGYIGPIHAAGTADENQVGGHNGLLRGLCEYYRWKKDARALAVIRSVVRALMLPTRPLFAHYPDHQLARLGEGRPIGLTVKNDGPWVGLSTDIGTVFFTLDGLTQAHAIDPSPELAELIETMIARYAQIDIRGMGAQTHATLSTLRGILRWWETHPRAELLALVRERYRLYRTFAETEHYANYNWFGRPEWTEACAVVDSFLLAVELWRATGDADYLSAAHSVYWNALSYAQRPNGGFGCDVCVGAAGRRHVSPHPKIFEAPWCCSMRGAEGLARAAQANMAVDPQAGMLWHLFYFEGETTLRFADGEIMLQCTSEYPFSGRVRWTVVRCARRAEVAWHCFVPPGVVHRGMRLTHRGDEVTTSEDGGFVRAMLTLAEGDEIGLEFRLFLAPEQPAHPADFPGHHRFAQGPLLLAAEQDAVVALAADEEFVPLGRARYRCVRTGTILAPINDVTFRSEAAAKEHRAQLLFPDLAR